MTIRPDAGHPNESNAETAANTSSRASEARRSAGTTERAFERGQMGELGAKALSAAEVLLREGKTFLEHNEDVVQAKTELSDVIRRNPLTALGVAFTTGILLAFLTRR
jgi:ElaB/YqjD/DUF883 family membrane-anchored ribosome-binding protein